ncbi:MAG: DUF4870 domain-containing protein [Acidimicrobiia bacterium]|jgi:uncharacterized Tic20 family protein
MTTAQPAMLDPALEITAEAKRWAAMSHLSAFVVFLGIPTLIGPFLVWLWKRDIPYVDEQGKEALNFNISFLIYGVASALLILLLIGLVLLPIVIVSWFVLVIVASVKASAGEDYRYPLTLRFIT